MKAFQFQLERVSRWRAVELSLEEAKLKRLLGDEAKLLAALAEVQAAISNLPKQIAALKEFHGRDLHAVAGYALRLSAERDKIRQRCREKRSEIDRQAKIHAQAKQRHQLLEELRARRHGEWQIESNREADELAHESYLARWGS